LPRCRRRAAASNPQQEFLQVDTSNILFICGGAFAGLEKIILNRTQKSGIGFTSEVRDINHRPHGSDLSTTSSPRDLIKYGPDPGVRGASAGGGHAR